MAPVFNAYEIFEIAEQIERNGAKFYRRAAEIATDDDGKQFLLDLARMEDQHEICFAKLKEKFQLESGNNELADVDSQMLGYLHSMAEGKVFSNIEDTSLTISPENTMEDIIRIAMVFEKDTVIYFSSVKELVPEDYGKSRLDALIKEEIGHIALLADRLRSLRA